VRRLSTARRLRGSHSTAAAASEGPCVRLPAAAPGSQQPELRTLRAAQRAPSCAPRELAALPPPRSPPPAEAQAAPEAARVRAAAPADVTGTLSPAPPAPSSQNTQGSAGDKAGDSPGRLTLRPPPGRP
jgi:hypothetical protein